MRTFPDGTMITAMRENAGLTIEALAAAVDNNPAFLRLMEQKRGIVSGPMPRKTMRYLVSLKAHERQVNVKVSARPETRRIPIAFDFACGAKTRAGTPHKHTAVYSSGRCKLHGGLSTGPKSDEGKDRIREGQPLRRERRDT